MKVYIINTGIYSAIGNNTSEHYEALINENTGIGEVELVPNLDQSFKGGEIKVPTDQLSEQLKINTSFTLPRTSLLAYRAALESIQGFEDFAKEIQLFSATSVGGMDLSEQFYNSYFHNDNKDRIQDLYTHDSGMSSFWLNDQLNFLKAPFTISSACSSAANAIIIAANSIKSGDNEIVMAGGTDALSRFTINGFNSLMIYDKELCRPFDTSRKGLNLGEGAAYLMLASEAFVEKNNITPVAEFKGGANSNDAYHQTASSPEAKGAILAMETALERAGVKPEEIDYVNAHGTATENNDNTEQKAIDTVFNRKIDFSSTKGFTGHTLAAAGGIEAVFSVLALQNNAVFANIHLEHPINQDNAPLKTTGAKEIRNILSNSFGFGGNSSSLIFGKI